MKDGFRALYCILKYNLPKAPWPIQFVFYSFIGGLSALFNLAVFALLLRYLAVTNSTLIAFFCAAGLNYYLSIRLLFRHQARWKSATELVMFLAVVAVGSGLDLLTTRYLIALGLAPLLAKAAAAGAGLIFNFVGRRLLVFPEPGNPDWRPQRPE